MTRQLFNGGFRTASEINNERLGPISVSETKNRKSETPGRNTILKYLTKKSATGETHDVEKKNEEKVGLLRNEGETVRPDKDSTFERKWSEPEISKISHMDRKQIGTRVDESPARNNDRRKRKLDDFEDSSDETRNAKKTIDRRSTREKSRVANGSNSRDTKVKKPEENSSDSSKRGKTMFKVESRSETIAEMPKVCPATKNGETNDRGIPAETKKRYVPRVATDKAVRFETARILKSYLMKHYPSKLMPDRDTFTKTCKEMHIEMMSNNVLGIYYRSYFIFFHARLYIFYQHYNCSYCYKFDDNYKYYCCCCCR